MRFIHSSDWHLGRSLRQADLLGDQAHALAQVAEMVKAEKPDAVLISGDIYDRAVPPPEAVDLLDWILGEIVAGCGVPAVLVAGNHDSPQRLGFGSRILGRARLHVFGSPAAEPAPVVFEDRHGPVEVHAVPYCAPVQARALLGDDSIRDHDAALAALLERFRRPAGIRRVLLTHALVRGGEPSESERALALGGAEAVDPARLEGYGYAALGHLHRPQQAAPNARYSGSLLAYSFSESGVGKSVALVEMGAAGACTVEALPLVPRRAVRRVEGTFEEILRGPLPGESPEDYLEVTLLDEGPVLDAMARIQVLYPNALQVLTPRRRSCTGGADAPRRPAGDHLQVVREFFSEVVGEDIGEAGTAALEEVIEKENARRREVAP